MSASAPSLSQRPGPVCKAAEASSSAAKSFQLQNSGEVPDRRRLVKAEAVTATDAQLL